MIVPVINFGDVLMSRPAGREAFLLARAYVFKKIRSDDVITLDFDGVKVLTPSWADEFITGIKKEYPNSIEFLNTENPSVSASLNIIQK